VKAWLCFWLVVAALTAGATNDVERFIARHPVEDQERTREFLKRLPPYISVANSNFWPLYHEWRQTNALPPPPRGNVADTIEFLNKYHSADLTNPEQKVIVNPDGSWMVLRRKLTQRDLNVLSVLQPGLATNYGPEDILPEPAPVVVKLATNALLADPAKLVMALNNFVRDFRNRQAEAARLGKSEEVSKLDREYSAWVNAYADLEKRIDFTRLDTNSVERYWAAKRTNAVTHSKQVPFYINKDKTNFKALFEEWKLTNGPARD